MKRIVTIVTVTCLSLILTALLLAVPVGAASDASLNVAYCNLSFSGDTHVFYAVASSDPTLKLLVWEDERDAYTYGSQDHVLSPASDRETIEGGSYAVFQYKGFHAHNMTDNIYVRACVGEGSDVTLGELHKYSILQYCYNMMGKVSGTPYDDPKLIHMLSAMLEYGAAAQSYQNHGLDRLATDDFYQITLTAGTLADGSQNGLYRPHNEVTLTAPETNGEGGTFLYWKDGDGRKVSDSATCTVTVENTHKMYTPVYISYSEGLEYDTNGDGTCYVIGMGTCTDTALHIPPVSPDGDTVIGIDAGAFTGEAITSLYLPGTIEDIGRRAFNGCDALLDVTFNGTSAMWSEVGIMSGNDPLTAATLHCLEAGRYIVTFLDHDASVISTQVVIEGEGAVAPADPVRGGYTFSGWDGAFDNVTADLTVHATYTIVHNQLYFTFQENGDGTTTAILSVLGDVKLYGLEFRLEMETSGMTYLSSVATVDGALCNRLEDGTVKYSYVNVTGRNNTQDTELLRVTFTDTGATKAATLTLLDVLIFDEEMVYETYTVAGHLYHS